MMDVAGLWQQFRRKPHIDTLIAESFSLGNLHIGLQCCQGCAVHAWGLVVSCICVRDRAVVFLLCHVETRSLVQAFLEMGVSPNSGGTILGVLIKRL